MNLILLFSHHISLSNSSYNSSEQKKLFYQFFDISGLLSSWNWTLSFKIITVNLVAKMMELMLKEELRGDNVNAD